MTSAIEDYALIGNCQTAAPGRPRRLDRLALLATLRLRGLLRRPPGLPPKWALVDRADGARLRGRRRRYRETR